MTAPADFIPAALNARELGALLWELAQRLDAASQAAAPYPEDIRPRNAAEVLAAASGVLDGLADIMAGEAQRTDAPLA